MSLAFVESIVRETHKHPLFSVVLVLCVAAMGWYSVDTFAEKSDVTLLKNKIETVESNLNDKIDALTRAVERGSLEQKMNAIETEIFQLERIANTEEATNRDLNRLGKLKIELGNLDRKLKEFSKE